MMQKIGDTAPLSRPYNQAFGKVIHTHLFFFFSQHSWHLGFSWSYVCQLVVQFTELCHGKFACTVRFFKFLLLCGDFFICLLKNLKIITKSSVNTQHTMHVHSNLCYGCLLWEMSIYRGCPLVEDQLYTLLARPSHFHTKPCSFSSIKKTALQSSLLHSTGLNGVLAYYCYMLYL